jgi:hypothetical protein
LERRQNLSSIRSRSWSSRIVTAFLMSHNVLQIPCKRKRGAFALFLIRTYRSDPHPEVRALALISPAPPSTVPFAAQGRPHGVEHGRDPRRS